MSQDHQYLILPHLHLLGIFKEQILIANLGANNMLIAIAKPFLDFDEVVMRNLHLSQFGSNAGVQIQMM